ncbi:MAG: hypothetical protein E7118_03160 [Bacteroidales bacterium]|nr:hypothetical protein [Bacteroidales bacterium]
MMEGYIDLKKLNMEELVGVVSLYPWFASARKELCVRMSGMGKDALGTAQYADSAMYIGSRRKISDIVRSSQVQDWSDADVEKLIKSYISSDEAAAEATGNRRSYAGVGDYFSQDDYEAVRRSDDNVFSKYAAKARQEKSEAGEDVEFDLYTETLAQIYAEQGYYEHAKNIYSKLILAYPEKSVYFASLIEKIDELN